MTNRSFQDADEAEIEQFIADMCDDGDCPFCGEPLESRSIFPDCDDEEIYCANPDCNYIGEIY